MTAISTAVAGAKVPNAATALAAAGPNQAAAARAAEALAAGYSAAFLAGAAMLLLERQHRGLGSEYARGAEGRRRPRPITVDKRMCA